MLTAESPAYPCSARKRQDRPVTPEVAGSSPVAPVFEVPAKRHLALSPEAGIKQRDHSFAAYDRKPVVNGDHVPHRLSANQSNCSYGRIVAAKRSSLPVRVSFQTTWKPAGLAVMPW